MNKPLENAEAEKCAQDIAAVINDKNLRQAVFKEYLDKHPGLKRWEGNAIGDRAVAIARAAANWKPAKYVSFDNGVCRLVRSQNPIKQREELLQACKTVDLGGKLLDDNYAPVAYCRRCASFGGFALYEGSPS